MTKKFQDSFEYQLKVPFKYATDGDQTFAQTLKIFAPKNKVLQWVSVLDSAVSRAILNFSKDAKEQEKTDANPVKTDKDKEQFAKLAVVLVSSNGKLNECFNALREILKSGKDSHPACQVDGKEEMNHDLFQKMSPVDTKAVLEHYIENFITSSLMS